MIIGFVESDAVLIIGGVRMGTDEIVALRSFFVDGCGRIGVFDGGGVVVDFSK
jgi:hypothetical protein